jgi:hypothetical protein
MRYDLPGLFCQAGVVLDATLEPQNGGCATNWRDAAGVSLMFIAKVSFPWTATDPKSTPSRRGLLCEPCAHSRARVLASETKAAAAGAARVVDYSFGLAAARRGIAIRLRRRLRRVTGRLELTAGRGWVR